MKRVWIYQSNRTFTEAEVGIIEQILEEFVAQWTAHGNQLAGTYAIKYNLFIFLEVDEEKAAVTGCSIDKSVHLLKKIEQELDVSLFDRLQLAYLSDRDHKIHVVSRADFEQLLKLGDITADTIVFNNMLTQADEIEARWEVPLKESWHAKVFL